jgi:hypothetical protein
MVLLLQEHSAAGPSYLKILLLSLTVLTFASRGVLCTLLSKETAKV